MLSSHNFVVVESYRLNRRALFEEESELLVEGWVISGNSVDLITIVFPDRTPSAGVELRLPSQDVWADQGMVFGDAARNARFRVTARVYEDSVAFASAKIRISFEGGGTWEQDIGPLFEWPNPPDCTDEDRELVARYESLGDNCEFGLFQRAVGVDRASLLRFASVGSIALLSDAIADSFGALKKRDAITLRASGKEWITRTLEQTLSFHTGLRVGSVPRHQAIREQRRKLMHLSRRFLGDCMKASHTFVFRTNDSRLGDDRGMDDGEKLYSALQCHGPCRLLWVTNASNTHPHASVMKYADHLYLGFIDQLAPNDNAVGFKKTSWLELLRNADVAIEAGRSS